MLNASVLGDVDLDLVPDKPWFKVYNHVRKLWEKVKLNHVMSIHRQPEILLKALNVNVCHDLLMFAGPQLTTIPNIRNDLQHDCASVKAKGEKRFLEAVASHGPKVLQKHAAANIAHRPHKQSRLQSHTPEASSLHTAAHPSCPNYQLAPPGPASSPRPLPQAKC